MTLSCNFSFFKAEKRMNSFYKLLVKESLDREDVDAMEKENIKDCHEIVQMFRQSNGIFHSFLCRTFVQLVIGSCIGLVLIRVVSQSWKLRRCSLVSRAFFKGPSLVQLYN